MLLYREIQGRRERAPQNAQPGAPVPEAGGAEELRLVTVLSVGLSAAGEEVWDRQLQEATERVGTLLYGVAKIMI